MSFVLLNPNINKLFVSFPYLFFIISFILFCHFFIHNLLIIHTLLIIFYFSFFLFSSSFNFYVFFSLNFIKFHISQYLLLLAISYQESSIFYNLGSSILQDINWFHDYLFSKLKNMLLCHWFVLVHNISYLPFGFDSYWIDQTSIVFFTIITKC